MKSDITIIAHSRSTLGKTAAKQQRKLGTIPCVVYLEDKKTCKSISIASADAIKMMEDYSIKTKVIELDVESDKKYTTVIREIQFDPIKDVPTHIDFMVVKEGEKIVVPVPVKVINKDKSVGVRRGGDVFVLLYNVPLNVEVGKIPSDVIVDAEGSNIGQKYQLSSMTLPEHTSYVNDALVAKVSGRRVLADPAAAAAEAAAEPAKA